jgi:hypothetical protein
MIFCNFGPNPDAVIASEMREGIETTRTISGTAVPWGEVGMISDGRKVRFHPGSLPADARPTVTLGHEGPAIGRVESNEDTAKGMRSTVKVSRVRDGDDALVLAADGVLGMFSVGADPTEFDHDDDGVLNVYAASWHHLALLPFGAFTGAVVDSVAASQHQGEPTMSDTAVVTADAPAPAVAAAAVPPAVVPISASHPIRPALTLSRLATLVAGANRGELTADAVRAELNAALANVTTTNVGAVVQPAYRSEINGLIDHGTPLLQALSQAPLPSSGMSIEYPEWVTLPTTGQQATEKTQIVSTPVTMTMKSAPVITIAGGNDISLQAVERSSPSFLEAYLKAAAVDWARKAEAYLLSRILAGAVAATPGATFLDNIKALLGALNPTLTPPGPLFVGMAWDVALPLITVKATDGPAFWSGKISFGSMLPEVQADGLNMFVDPNLPSGVMVAGSKAGATWHQQGPADVRVVDVSLLGLDVGVYGYASATIEYPSAFATLDTTP